MAEDGAPEVSADTRQRSNAKRNRSSGTMTTMRAVGSTNMPSIVSSNGGANARRTSHDPPASQRSRKHSDPEHESNSILSTTGPGLGPGLGLPAQPHIRTNPAYAQQQPRNQMQQQQPHNQMQQQLRQQQLQFEKQQYLQSQHIQQQQQQQQQQMHMMQQLQQQQQQQAQRQNMGQMLSRNNSLSTLQTPQQISPRDQQRSQSHAPQMTTAPNFSQLQTEQQLMQHLQQQLQQQQRQMQQQQQQQHQQQLRQQQMAAQYNAQLHQNTQQVPQLQPVPQNGGYQAMAGASAMQQPLHTMAPTQRHMSLPTGGHYSGQLQAPQPGNMMMQPHNPMLQHHQAPPNGMYVYPDGQMGQGTVFPRIGAGFSPMRMLAGQPIVPPRMAGRRRQAIPWTKDEDKRLINMVKKHGAHNWRVIAAGIGTRTPAQAAQRWRKTLDPSLTKVKKGKWTKQEDDLLRELIDKHSDKNWHIIAEGFNGTRTVKHCRERWLKHISPDLKNNEPWSVEEDSLLLRLRQELGYNGWAEIARRLPGRTDNAVKRRYRTLDSSRQATRFEYHWS